MFQKLAHFKLLGIIAFAIVFLAKSRVVMHWNCWFRYLLPKFVKKPTISTLETSNVGLVISFQSFLKNLQLLLWRFLFTNGALTALLFLNYVANNLKSDDSIPMFI